MGELRGERLRCERLTDPLAIGSAAPRLSWIAAPVRAAAGGAEADAARGQQQSGWRVRAAADEASLAAGERLLWDSGRVAGDEAIAVAWGGPALRPGERVVWDVQLWDRDGAAGPRSAPATFAAGIADWGRAAWVGHGHPWAEHQPPSGEQLDPLHNMGMSSALLRHGFRVELPVTRATVYATARGLYRLRINGERVGDHELAPGWTDYRRRIHYQAFDVTALMRDGDNALGVELGEGWYAGYLGWLLKKAGGHYGQRPSALVKLVLEHADGTVGEVVSGPQWRATRGPRVHSDLQHGERYDARLHAPGWDAPGFDQSRWEAAVEHAPPAGAALEPQPNEPVRVVQQLPAVALSEVAPGTWLFDLGQNMVGWARLRAAGPRGTVVTLRFGEALDGDGRLYTENLRTAAQRDVVVLCGDPSGGGETFEPAFTCHGFRYVEVSGLAEPPRLEDLVGRVVHSDAPWTGGFHSSDELLNAIERNVEWGQRGNFVAIPTDCPQRDERLGWLADTQVFAPTALLNMDCTAFFEKWLQDVRDAQADDGAFPDVAPLPPDYEVLSHGAPAWGDAGVIVPWAVWQASGERRVLEAAYPSIERWMAHIAQRNPDHVRSNALYNSYGDWLGVGSDTDKALLATAYWALDALLVTEIARALGRMEREVARWASLHARVAAAFRATWLDRDGRLRPAVATQTACLLALHARVLDGPAQEALVARQLADDVIARGRRLSTGFVGTALLCPLLSEHGHPELAWDLALADTLPSWGASVRAGATTMWERWDGWTAEDGFASPNMNSFNHYAFGAIGEWLFRHAAGLDQQPGSSGWAHLRVRPFPDARLRWARAHHDGPRGPLRAGWERLDDELALTVALPPGTRATVHVPAADPALVRERGRPLDAAPGVTLAGVADGRVLVDVAAGDYLFTAPWSHTGAAFAAPA
ncbi:family 78 glycoside hydrolase catalytic domain [Conexibacter sp. JD483]|uniref:alpha-L-rhamnosidase n=1 Tax=unclassified Conexibacter TaxID=2627773 RepID=UPI00271F3766|nr:MULTISPECIES: alpha-L-rhamnosidase [unclassified Conexibacter]MDO8188263.1 family 78 glycoside hydrolase catalytic domain [Conexibacter sp. CPCC 205706]MDO8197382.1 family 78 glycoside hydrolase catalytic domain [Conexibacter sp. CPCC 205762]MDR9370158.1 family 78 glycoside hydrolase catalytic domain [Conexibacter sp. JD483]